MADTVDSMTTARAVRGVAVTIAGALLALACADLGVDELDPVTEVVVTPDTVLLRIGGTAQLRAAPIDGAGTLIPQAVPMWTTGTPGIATVDDSGRVVAVGAGTATLSASVGGVQGDAVAIISGEPVTMILIGGNVQSAGVNSTLPIAPAVLVTDAGGHPVANETVTFEVTAGGGSVASGTVVTGRTGIATTSWTMGPSPGPQEMTATGSSPGLSADRFTFTATAVVGPPDAAASTVAASPATIAPSGGQSVSTITVTVRDALGRTITGASVTLAATGSGNTINQSADTTDAFGRAFGSISSTVAEAKVVTATVNGTVAIAQGAALTVSANVPAGLAVLVQPQGAVSNATFTTQPVVEFRDGFGNRVLGATGAITVSLVHGDGVLLSNGGALTVNAVDGRATFNNLLVRGLRTTGDTLGTGPHVLQFSAAGYASVRADTLPVEVSYAYNVVEVYQRGCIGCHNYTYANSFNVPTAFGPCVPRVRVVPFDTLNSMIYEKMRSATPVCGQVMPLTGVMSPRILGIVRHWILQGARNN